MALHCRGGSGYGLWRWNTEAHVTRMNLDKVNLLVLYSIILLLLYYYYYVREMNRSQYVTEIYKVTRCLAVISSSSYLEVFKIENFFLINS